ncbi:MAG: GAF domain-containing protein [Magnetovibrionaceae bacterium]
MEGSQQPRKPRVVKSGNGRSRAQKAAVAAAAGVRVRDVTSEHMDPSLPPGELQDPSPALISEKTEEPARVRELERKLRQAEMLLDLSRKVAAIESLDEVLATLVKMTNYEIKCERGTLFLNDPATNELYSRVAQGNFNREIRILNNTGVAGHVFSTGQGTIIHDAYADARFNRTIDEQTGFRTKSILCVPIKTVTGDVIGAAQMLNKEGSDFTVEDQDLLEAMTTQAAVALQSTQFVEKMKKTREQELEFLDVVSDVTSEIDLAVLLKRVMGEATRMLQADRSTLFMNDEKTNELWAMVGEGLAAQIRLPNSVGIAGAVFTSNQTVNIPYAYADLRFNPSFDKQTGYFTRSILCIPVTNKAGKVIGVTQCLNKRGGPFTDEDEQRLKAFTSQVAIALENAKLFDDVQNMKNYNEAMLESMSSGVITLDEEQNVVTCNAAGLRILSQKARDMLNKPATEIFAEPNDWVLERIKKLEEVDEDGNKLATQDVLMDAGLEVNGEHLSVNMTIQPLVNAEEKELGTMLMFEDISSEKRMKSTMSRYMDPGLADQLMEGGEDILGGRSTEATVLFSDVRGFTTITESLGAQGTVQLLNEYFTIMVDIITEEGGMLDKFIGDAIMAGFGVPVGHDDDPDRAMRAAITMLVELDKWNVEREAKGLLPVNMGIGLNTDNVVSGNIGSPKRMDYTMIGDGVNLAARLESACKQYSAKLLISEYTQAQLKGTYRTRDVDLVVVKGKTQPVGVVEVLDFYSEDQFPNVMDVVNYFKDGVHKFRTQKWDPAIKAFEECLKANPNDKLSETYIERCNHMKAEPPGDDWNGVWVLTSK